MAYDAATGTVVLFGGFGRDNRELADTWTWGGLRLQKRVGYPVAESQQAGSGQCYRQGAAPPDGVG
jgi:hypothetical protein